MDEKYYWLKIHEHFFDDEKILYLESVKNGEKYILFWQKLLLKCLKNRFDEDAEYGFIRFSEKLPYTPELLSKITRVDIDTIKVAIDLFQKLEMIEILDNGTIYIEEVNKLIGKESSSAERVRRHREKKKMLQCNKSAVTCNANKRKKNKNKYEYKIYGTLNNVKLTLQEYNKLIKDYDKSIINKYIESLSTYIPNRRSKPYKDHYAVIRSWLNKDNISKQQKIEIPEDSKIDLNEEWI